MNKRYFSLEKSGTEANINIYGDICSWAFEELGEVSSATLSRQLEGLDDVSKINVYINSYGGEVAEGLAIYNALKRHKAKVVTHCDGFACSIASVIFMAGDERVMNDSSLLMIHNAWTYATGNADELRKQADDLDKITQASINAYKANSTLDEEKIQELMNGETWILPNEALEYGFATKINENSSERASQNAFKQLFEIIKKYQLEDEEETTEGTEETETEETPTDTTADKTEDEQETETTEDTGEETTEQEPEETEEEENKENEASQKWLAFFNAISK